MKSAPSNIGSILCVALAASVIIGCGSKPDSATENAIDPSNVASAVVESENADVAAPVTETVEPVTAEVAPAPEPEVTVEVAPPVINSEPPAQNDVAATPSTEIVQQPTTASPEVQPTATSQPVENAVAPVGDSQIVALAESGDADAQYQLAVANDANPEESNKWYLKAAEQGNTDAQMVMAVRYALGQGVEKNLQEAERWLAMAEGQEQHVQQDQNVTVVGSSHQVRVQPRSPWIPITNPIHPPQLGQNWQQLQQTSPPPVVNFPTNLFWDLTNIARAPEIQPSEDMPRPSSGEVSFGAGIESTSQDNTRHMPTEIGLQLQRQDRNLRNLRNDQMQGARRSLR